MLELALWTAAAALIALACGGIFVFGVINLVKILKQRPGKSGRYLIIATGSYIFYGACLMILIAFLAKHF
ncbi:hypothetical protein FWF89_00030 [Candidatus Saccharibacteria bacterium]|nr:hypothetical protein [Candidatus Saccharibacteria bacterium]